MNIPSPAALKQKLDEKRASETTQQEKVSSTSKQKTSTGRNTTVSRKSSAKRQRLEKESGSIRESGVRARTGRSKSSIEDSENSDRSRRNTKPTKMRSEERSIDAKRTTEKKPFVRREHLTQKPLRDNEALAALKKSLERSSTPKRGTNSRAPHRVPRPTSGGPKRKNHNKEKN